MPYSMPFFLVLVLIVVQLLSAEIANNIVAAMPVQDLVSKDATQKPILLLENTFSLFTSSLFLVEGNYLFIIIHNTVLYF